MGGKAASVCGLIQYRILVNNHIMLRILKSIMTSKRLVKIGSNYQGQFNVKNIANHEIISNPITTIDIL